MTRKELEDRTKRFHINVIHLCSLLPKNAAGYEIAKQLIRAAGSVGSNYRATRRAKSKADFNYKIAVVLEETDESLYWLEVIRDGKLLDVKLLHDLIAEAEELTRIFAASNKTASKNK